MVEYRYNLVAARVVDDGMALRARSERAVVARFLHQNGVCLRVIVRVLAPAGCYRDPIPTLVDRIALPSR